MDKFFLLVKKNKVFIFPFVIILFVLVMSLLQISGTSSGVYDYYFGKDTNATIVGEPRTVRSDEWAVNTPFITAQYESGFPTYNSRMGSGQDMSLVVDVPYLDWSILFKPQNWIFFIAPLETAFAFKWWFLAAILMLSIYFLVLSIYPKKVLLGVLISLLFFFSPFIQWWYQSITILPIAFGVLTLVMALRVLREKTFKKSIFPAILTAYLATCFILVMYPAFQITVGLVLAGILCAVLFGKKELNLLTRRKNVILALSVVLIAITTLGVFLLQHYEGIKSILETVYPGSRNVTSGGMNIFSLLSWPLSFLLLNSETAHSFNFNQSEASNFLLVSYVALPLLGYLFLKKKVVFSRSELALLILMLSLSVIFAIRMFVPAGDALFNAIGLSKVPHIRLFIGLGIINIILLTAIIGRETKDSYDWKKVFSKDLAVCFIVAFLIYFALVATCVNYFMIDSIGIKKIFTLSLAFSVPTTLILSSSAKIRYIGLVFLVIGGFLSSANVNPLYRGLPTTENSFSNYVKSRELLDNYYWVANDSVQLSSLLVSSGAEVLGGVNTYPQKTIWDKTFLSQEKIYNRYAHVRFTFNADIEKPYLELIQSDSFYVHTSPCDSLLSKLNIKYIVSEVRLPNNCQLAEDEKIFNKKTLYIYTLQS